MAWLIRSLSCSNSKTILSISKAGPPYRTLLQHLTGKTMLHRNIFRQKWLMITGSTTAPAPGLLASVKASAPRTLSTLASRQTHRLLVSCLVRFCSNATGSLSAFLARNAVFRQLKPSCSLQIFARHDTSLLVCCPFCARSTNGNCIRVSESTAPNSFGSARYDSGSL